MSETSQNLGVGPEESAQRSCEELQAAPNSDHHLGNQFSRIRKFVAGATAFFALSGTGGLIGASIDDTPVTIGPHNATAELSFDQYAAVDLGFVGDLRVPSPVSWAPLGVEIRIQEIPDNNEDTPVMPTFEELQGEVNASELERYANLYGNIGDDFEKIKLALLKQIMRYSVISSIGLGVGYGVIGRRRWHELALARKIALTVAATSLLMPSDVVTAPQISADPGWIRVETDFANNLPRGLEVRGKLMRLIVPSIEKVASVIDENNRFYDQVIHNIDRDRTDRPLLPEDDSTINFSFVTDNHCNVGMVRVIKHIREITGTELDLNAGDTTFSGTDIEEPCTDTDDDVVVIGNHDDERITRKQLEERGSLVLSGEIIEVEGLTIVGDDDLRRSEFGAQKYFRSDETHQEMSRRLRELTCNEAEGVDIVMVHDQDDAKDVCANIILAGHSHESEVRLYEPVSEDEPTKVYIDGGTTGGSVSNGPTVGPLRGEATMVIGQIDKESGALVRYRVITVLTSGQLRYGVLTTVN